MRIQSTSDLFLPDHSEYMIQRMAMAKYGEYTVPLDHGSEDYNDLKCSPCNEDGVNQNASKYCSECAAYLCTVCARYHRRLPDTKNHEVVDVTNDNSHLQDKTSYNQRGEQRNVSEKCVYHPERAIELYCKSHDMVYCALCIATEHRSCEGVLTLTVDTLPDVSGNQTDSLLKEVENNIKTLPENVTKVNDNIRTVDTQQTKILEEIEEVKTQLFDQIGKMKQNIVAELSEIHLKLKTELNVNVSEITALIEQLDQTNKKLRNCSGMNAVETFICTKLAQNITTCSKQLQHKVTQTGKQSLNFQPTNDLLGILSKGTLGSVCVKDDDISVQKVQSVEEVGVKTDSDKCDCFLIDICQLPNGTIILADNKNGTLKRLNGAYKVCEQFELVTGPLSISTLGEDRIAVKLNNNQIQLVRVTDHMSSIMTFNIKRKKTHFGLVYEKDKLWVNENYRLCAYDESGTLVSSFDMEGTFLAKQTFQMTFNKENQNLIIANGNNGFTCVGTDGRVLRTITDSRLNGTRGVCITGNRTLLVTGRYSNNIVMFIDCGECLGEVKLPNNITFNDPYSLLYDGIKHQLLVTSGQHSKIYIIQF